MEEYSNPIRIQPDIDNSLSHGWKTMKKQFLPLFLVTIILAILDSIFGASNQGVTDRPNWPILDIIGLAFWLLFIPVIGYSADMMFVQAVRDIRIDVKDIIAGFNNFLNIILANLLVMALVGIALIALIIPGIIVACRLAFVSYLVMDKHMDPIAAVETSWKMTRGYGWTIFGLGLFSILIFIVGLILFIVGTIPAVMWIKTSFAFLYQTVLEQTDESIFVKEDHVQ